jgi:hypothetical protein
MICRDHRLANKSEAVKARTLEAAGFSSDAKPMLIRCNRLHKILACVGVPNDLPSLSEKCLEEPEFTGRLPHQSCTHSHI